MGKKLRTILGTTMATAAAMGASVAVAAPSHAAACGSGYTWCSTNDDSSASATISIRTVNGHDVADIAGEIASSNCENLWLVNYTTGKWTPFLMHQPFQSAGRCTVNVGGISDSGVTLGLAVYSPTAGKYLYTGSH